MMVERYSHGNVQEELTGGKVPEKLHIKFQNLFETPVFKTEVNKYFHEIFPNLFEKYKLVPAKGGTEFEEYADMSYPMHILNGILPAMLYLEKKLLENEYTSEWVKKEDPDVIMLIKCTLVGITLHDINKIVGKSNLKESLYSLNEVLSNLNLKLSDEEANIVKYLVVGTEDRTRYTIPDVELPKRRNLERVIKDYLLPAVHLADSISVPPPESLSDLFRLLQEKILKYFPDVHAFYFNDSPYEVLSRYLQFRLLKKIEGKIILISPKGFLWIGKPLAIEDVERMLLDLEKEYKKLLQEKLEDFITCDWQKAQLDIFRYVHPTKDFIKDELIPTLLEKKRNDILFRGLPRDNIKKEHAKKEIEKLEADGKIDVMVILKLLLTLSTNNAVTEKRKSEYIRKYYPEIKDVKDPVEKNVKKIIIATNQFNGNIDELYNILVELLVENYKEEKINILEVFKTVLSYAYLDNKPFFGIRTQDVGEKRNICLICGAEANIAAKEGVAFGFSARGFTNRTVVSLKNEESKICKICLAEITLRKLVFGESEDQYAVYIDASDYTIPIINAKKVAEKIENAINDIRGFSSDEIYNLYKIVYGYDFKEDSKYVLVPFLMAYTKKAKKEADFLEEFYWILSFATNTGFKVYLTYPMNPDRIRKETFISDYAFPSIKRLKWDEIRMNKLEYVKDEFEILMNLAKKINRKGWKNELTRVLNDYSTSPLSFFYYLSRLESPSGFFDKNKDKIQTVYERIGGNIMGIIEMLADKASEIEWSGDTASKQTEMFRIAIEALKIGVQRKLPKEDIIAIMAGMITKRVNFPKEKEIEELCKMIYEQLYEKVWNKKIPSKAELRYWKYAFAFEYLRKSEEKRQQQKDEKKNDSKEVKK